MENNDGSQDSQAAACLQVEPREPSPRVRRHQGDFGNIDATLAGIDKVEVFYVKNDSVPSKGIVKAPHGKTVFWKPSSNTYTVKEPCFAMEDENAVPNVFSGRTPSASARRAMC